MAPKARKRTRESIPDDPDKDPWTQTQVTKAYNIYVSQQSLRVSPSSQPRVNAGRL